MRTDESTDALETAVPAGADPRGYARELARMHADAFSGNRPRRRPRRVIGNSWKRLLGAGMDPDRARQVRLLDERELTLRRERFRLPELLETLRASLAAIAEQSATIMVLADGDGRVLWRDGSPQVRKQADRLGFVPGSDWAERTVGTNAIGTALVVRHPVQVYSAEHFLRSHHPWTCAAAPVRDPRDGGVLGVVDLSGPIRTVHPSTLALATTAAKLAESELGRAHRAELERLRAVAVPALAGAGGKALVTDPHGWVAAAGGVAPVERVLLPNDPGQRTWLPAFGACACEPVPGGWLIRLEPDAAAGPAEAKLDLRAPHRPLLRLDGPSGSWDQPLTPRHAEILYLLARHPRGRSAAELAADLFGDAERTVTIRAEMSRLRRHFAGVLAHRPYRFTVEVQVLLPDDGVALPGSVAPGLR